MRAHATKHTRVRPQPKLTHRIIGQWWAPNTATFSLPANTGPAARVSACVRHAACASLTCPARALDLKPCSKMAMKRTLPSWQEGVANVSHQTQPFFPHAFDHGLDPSHSKIHRQGKGPSCRGSTTHALPPSAQNDLLELSLSNVTLRRARTSTSEAAAKNTRRSNIPSHDE